MEEGRTKAYNWIKIYLESSDSYEIHVIVLSCKRKAILKIGVVCVFSNGSV